jgi:hypothetical protein
MQPELKAKIQQRVQEIRVPHIRSLHSFPGVPETFKPWECGLSPSALYSCSLTCRKRMKIKTPEVKWMSIKRWVTTTPGGIELPAGVFFSIKRREEYAAVPKPHFVKQEFVLMMFPYGNVWSQRGPDDPITEEWLFEESSGSLILEHLMKKDAAFPVDGYFKSAYQMFKAEDAKRKAGQSNILWIHTKRKDKANSEQKTG